MVVSLSQIYQIVLFLFLFDRPVWAMASLIIGQLTASGYMFALAPELQVSLRFFWAALAFLLLVPILKNRGGIKLGSKSRRILIPAILFFALATIANVVNTDLDTTFQYFRQVATALIILVLLPATVEKERDIKLLSLVAIITCIVSAIVAVMQHYSFLGLPIYTLYPDMFLRGRTLGLAESEVQLSIYLPIIILPTLGVLLLKGVSSGTRDILIFAVVIMCAALYWTYTRSGIAALGLGFLAFIPLVKSRIRLQLLLVVLLILAGFGFYTNWQDNRYSQGFTDDQSAASRLVLWQASLNVALDNPVVGIGYDQFVETASEYSLAIDPELMETQGAGSAIGVHEPHNDFLRVWLSFGTPALLAFIVFIIGIFRNFIESYRKSQNTFLKGLSLGCTAALVAYIVGASIHNVMDSMFLIWILGGLSIAITKISVPARQPVRQ